MSQLLFEFFDSGHDLIIGGSPVAALGRWS
jgi:hypothetical protein